MGFYLTKLEKVEGLRGEELEKLKEVTALYPFRASKYYLSLINWDDPEDPIRRIIIPNLGELEKWGRVDPSNEKSYTVLPGLEHKYNSTALFLVSGVCGGICRYCFRKRLFMFSKDEILRDIDGAVDYVRSRKEITNVLLSGGDPLMLSTEKLERVIKKLSEIDHVKIIRIGTKMPAFNPYRILDDPSLVDMIKRYSRKESRIYIITHFNHPKEITKEAVESVNMLHNAGAIFANQTPLIRGVNDKPEVLADLFRKLSFIGVPPYYVFQIRPAVGNKPYAVPLEEGYEIFEKAKGMVSGLAKRARFVMSHASGKIEVVGKTDDHVYLKYHRAANDDDSGRFMVFKSNPEAYWFDDYDEVIKDYAINYPYRAYGPD